MRLKRDFIVPGSTLVIAIIAIFLLMMLTSPIDKLGWAILFFGLLFVALMSLGSIVVRLWGGELNTKNRFRTAVISLFVIISLMFRSAQSFNWVDGLIVILVVFGLLFYGGRRF